MTQQNLSTGDIVTELHEINAIGAKSAASAAEILVDNYMLRYESVSEDDTDLDDKVRDHFISFANEAVRHILEGHIVPTKERARALEIVRLALHQANRLDLTEAAIVKLDVASRAMRDWCAAMDKLAAPVES